MIFYRGVRHTDVTKVSPHSMSLQRHKGQASALAAAAVSMFVLAAPAAAQVKGAIAPADLTFAAARVDGVPTATPIKHLVIIDDQSVSFDHYFATYPHAANPPGEPGFTALPGTPVVNNLLTAHLLAKNPNAAKPFRLDPGQTAATALGEAYTAQQKADDNGQADLFAAANTQAMGYYDGNTVAAIWSYAQHFALDDNAYADGFGPATPGALNLVSGQTNGLTLIASSQASYYVHDGAGGLTLINNVDPGFDVCSSKTDQANLSGKNIGDLLNTAGLTWGGFTGGFDLGATNANGTTGCARSTPSPAVGQTVTDYVPHLNWFQFFRSTANPTHARPLSLGTIGYSLTRAGLADPANHEYDLSDFFSAVQAGNYPSVSYISLPAYQNGDAGYSDPADEQTGLVTLINFLQSQPDWASTAIILTYDDGDGWYDHAFTPPTNPSADPLADQLNGPGACGAGTPPAGVSGQPVNGRCGPGARIPVLVISPWARPDYVDKGRITQASVLRFIEDNWLGGTRLGGGAFDADAGSIMAMFDFSGVGKNSAPILDPATGQPAAD
jgi:phospholipase C